MGKGRNRQPDVMDDGSEDSSESGEKANTGVICQHVTRAVNLGSVIKVLKKTGINLECETCKKLHPKKDAEEEDNFSTPLTSIMPLWICLRCGNQACGRGAKGHAYQHFKTPRSDSHCLALDTHQWSIWCYQCENEVNPASSRKPLLTNHLRFIKKLSYTSSPVSQEAIPLPSIQTENQCESLDNDTPNVQLNDLTRVVGLANLGNTCFFNAVLQCLSQTPFLVKVLEDLREPGEKFILPGGQIKVTPDSEELELPPIEGSLEGWGTFTSILCKTLNTMQSMKTNQTFEPKELLNCFKRKTVQCMDGGQHDSHELLRHLLELVRNEDLRRYQAIILKETGIHGTKKCPDDTVKASVKFYGRQASARLLGPELVFRGTLVSTLECLECHHSSQRTEPFLDLSLPVMADKPQPPVLKRKNSGFDDTFDSMGNNISNTPSAKHQFKKEHKNAEKHRKAANRPVRIRMRETGSKYIPPANANSISEENQAGAPELEESDADIEDNISAPEIVESGYSSEKVSALASPVSPMDSDLSNNPMSPSELNMTPLNGNVPLSPTDASDSSRLNDADSTIAEFAHQSSIKLTAPLSAMVWHSSDFNSAESPTTEAGIDAGELPGLSPSTSLIVNSELSPEAATISPLSSPITSKDSPTSPPSSATDGEYMQAEINEIRLLIENPSITLQLADMETPEYQTPQTPGDQSPPSVDNTSESKAENGIADITKGLSKVCVTGNSQPTRYPTTDGDCSIQSCLNQFTALELMSASNKVGCEACTARENKDKEGSTKLVCTQSTKQYLISRVPAVLIFHLKRFQSQRIGFRKVVKHVSFPMVLDLAPVCKGGGKPKIYSLYGVIEHSGTLHGGHYVAYVKTRPPLTPDDPRWAFLPSKDSKDSDENSSTSSSDSEADEAKAPLTAEPPPGRWYYVSDSRVREVDESTVLGRQAYMLFYERIL